MGIPFLGTMSGCRQIDAHSYPVRSIIDLKVLLFDDLRIDEELFLKLDFNFIIKIAPLYHSNTLLTLVKYIKELQNVNY